MAAERHLLFGLLALQTGLIQQAQLVAAFHAWTCDKSRSLADCLFALGHLDGARRAAIEALADLHVEAQGGDVEKSLAAVPARRSTRESLTRLADADISASLGHIRTTSTHADDDADRTANYGIGTPTRDSQRFRILRPHAHGGLGEVFVALDAELHREVALKQILEKHADDLISRQRFVAEAEITGGLEHPGIVPVYGLGTDAGGRPYYAMRFIKGDSLKEAIERFHADHSLTSDSGRRSLELRKLLRRFLDVCNAIDYAHSRGVIHRDIKPANIILGKHGETLVVDWGLAKAIGRADPLVGEQTIAPSSSGSSDTLPGSALGTPGYMSPEQASGDLEQLGPRSDVYSLGATLYCLLTNKPPFEGDDVGEILRKVQSGEFRAPREVDPSLDNALEAVCMKAMARAPHDRYANCRALAEDVERWGADEPVSAYREPLSRRARRWAKRNRTLVATAVVALAAGVVGLSAVVVVQTQAKADIARALVRETQARTALAEASTKVQARYELALEAITTFHTGVSEDFLLREDQFKMLRDQLLKSASDFYAKLGALLGKETDVASRRALAVSNFQLADLTEKVGHKEAALAAHRAVLAYREALAAAPEADADTRADVGRSLTAVASLLDSIGNTDEALATYRGAESLLVRLVESNSDVTPIRRALADCQAQLGWLLYSTSKPTDGLQLVRKARFEQEILARADGATIAARRELADTIHRIGRILFETGRPTEGVAEYRKSLALRLELVNQNPTAADLRNGLATGHNNLGFALARTSRFDEAEAEHRKALAIRQKLAVENPAVTDFRKYLGHSHHNLGLLYSETGRPGEAVVELRECLGLYQRIVDDNPGVTDVRVNLADAHHLVGIALRQVGRLPEADTEFRLGLEIFRKLADDNPSVTTYRIRLVDSHDGVGENVHDLGKTAEALAEIRRSLEICGELVKANPSVTDFQLRLAVYGINAGILLSQANRALEADGEFGKGKAVLQKLANDNPTVPEFRLYWAVCNQESGKLRMVLGRTKEADAEYRQARSILEKLVADDPKASENRYRLVLTLGGMSEVNLRLGRVAESCLDGSRAIALGEVLVKEYPEPFLYRSALAFALRRRAQARSAGADFAGAAADNRRAVGVLNALQWRRAEDRFETACCHAAISGLVGQPGAGVSDADGREEAARAMGLLRKAIGMGYRNVNVFRTESALDPLRARDDFRLLIMDIDFPAELLAPGQRKDPPKPGRSGIQ
jgi:serine/threonine-protein kinase